MRSRPSVGWLAVAGATVSVVAGQQFWTEGNTTDLTINLLNLRVWPWGATYRMRWDAVNPPAQLFFTCSDDLDVERVNQAAFNGCTIATGSGGDTIPPSSSSPGVTASCQANHQTTTDSRPLSLSSTTSDTFYYISLTNGTGSRLGGGATQGGACATRGAKVAVEYIPINSPLLASGGAYSCDGKACPTQTTCRFRPCSFGSCFAEQLVSAGTTCDDENSLTASDECNALGECAGTANYTVTLRFATNTTALIPASTVPLQPFQLAGVVSNLTGGMPLTLANAFQFSVVEEFAATHVDVQFSVVDFRNYNGGSQSLAAEMNRVVGRTVLYRNAQRVITAVIAVSDTPTQSPTVQVATGAPTAAGQANAAAGAGGVVGTLEDNYIYIAAGAGVFVLIAILVVVRSRKKRDGPTGPIAPRSPPALNPTYQPEEDVNQIIDRTSIRVVAGQTRPRADTGDTA